MNKTQPNITSALLQIALEHKRVMEVARQSRLARAQRRRRMFRAAARQGA